MLFFRCLWLALWWKNFVFLSLACNQIDLDHCHQWISSWYNIVLISSTLLISSKCPHGLSLVNSSNILCFSWILLFHWPKVTWLHPTNALLHCLTFSNKQYMGLLVVTVLLQTCWITASQSGCVTHFSPNLRGIFLTQCRWLRGCVVRRKGTWSEYEAWRWETRACGNNSFHSIVAHALSSLSWTKASPSFPLFQVKMFPLYPKLIKLKCNSMLWKLFISYSGLGFPPSFSLDTKISL